MKQIKSMTWLGVGGALLLPALAVAALDIPNTVAAGDPVSASEMNANFEAVKAKVEELEGLLAQHTTNAAWTAPALLNGWENYTGFTAAEYRKDSHGMVHLRGHVRNGAVDTAIFNLPEGYRPAVQVMVPVVNGTGAGGLTRLYVHASGNLNTYNGNDAFVSLDGVSFYAGE